MVVTSIRDVSTIKIQLSYCTTVVVLVVLLTAAAASAAAANIRNDIFLKQLKHNLHSESFTVKSPFKNNGDLALAV